jgi:acetyltransferase-like isoleucine patch superfamily enzyme
MAYLSQEKLEAMGFKSLGKNVQVSDRAAIHNADQIELGDYARIDDFCVVSGRVVMGRYTFLGVHCNVAGGTTGVFMADFSAAAYGVHLLAQSDDYQGLGMAGPRIPVRFRRETKKPVRLEPYSLVAVNSVILPGITLAEGSSVLAMSLVTKSTQPWSMYFGVPAKRLKSRKKDLLEHARRFLEEEAAARVVS